MGNFFDNLWNEISLLVWSDWLTLLILAYFIVKGFFQGFAKELISLVFLILAIFVSWLFYENLANTLLSDSDISQIKSFYGLSFAAIAVAFWLAKIALYKVTELASYIENPCSLNKCVAIIILLALIAVFSWNYISVLADIEIMSSYIENTGARNWLAFAVIYTIIFFLVRALIRLLNITIDTKDQCLMGLFFAKVLNLMSVADNILNARNIISLKNKFLGAFIGLFKGSLLVLVIVLVLQNVNWVSQQYFWIETQGALRQFQDLSVAIKPSISKYLIFVELEPGDEIIIKNTLEIKE